MKLRNWDVCELLVKLLVKLFLSVDGQFGQRAYTNGSWGMEFISVSWRYRKGKDVSRILPASHKVGDHGTPFLAQPLSQSNRQRGALWTPRWGENSLEEMFTASRTTILPLGILFKGLFGKSGAMGQAHPP